MRYVSAALLATTLLSLSAGGCGSGDADGSASPSDAGADATQLQPGDAEICRNGCALLPECDPAADTSACEAQCEQELLGNGYLIPHVARAYFKRLGEVEEEPCNYVNGRVFGEWYAFPERIDEFLEQPDVMAECTEAAEQCDGPLGIPGGYKPDCLRVFYRYNEPKRDELRKCFAKDCVAPRAECIATAAVPGEPWLVGIEKTNPNF